MSTPHKKRIDTETIALWVGLLLVLSVTVVFYAGYLLGALLTGARITEWNPLAAALGVMRGTAPWSVASTVVSSLVAVALLAAAGAFIWRKVVNATPATRVDKAGAMMGSGADIAFMKKRAALADARRLGVDSPGLPIAKTLSGEMLFSGWENVCVDIWGPRTGKTTSRAIPGILAAPGAVIVTSNKRDVLDATRGVREEVGDVWIFDPQQVAAQPPTWWWNPLSYVVDEVKAKNLAEHFASGSREEGARTDAFFDSAAKNLLAGLLLAAAKSSQPITTVYRWLTSPTDDSAVVILEEAGYTQIAQTVDDAINSPDKQRAGVFSVALQMASCLMSPAVLQWVTPPADDEYRPEFSAHDFVRASNTLYLLSKEGAGTAGPLVTALTVAVVEAAEELAIAQGGRLRLPMVAMLDEAANVCRWRELPNLYSHYGSRGIVICTILQSWSQGVVVWGREGMRKLWSAANIKVYGGGVSETEFLNELSQLIGDYVYSTVSVSRNRNSGSSRSIDSDRKDRILDVSDLAALPRGRAVVFASGAPAVLVQTTPWYRGENAAAVTASLKKYDPAHANAKG